MTEKALSRRGFIKASALAGVSAAIGASMAGCMEKTSSEDGLSDTGQTAFPPREYDRVVKTVCHGCIQACPCIAYVKNDVIVRLEGNPDACMSRGSLCLKGLNQLNTLYSPRHVMHPLKRAGERGENKWEQVTWEEALDFASDKIVEAINKYGPYSIFYTNGGGGGMSSGETWTLGLRLGSPNFFEPGAAQCYLPRMAINHLVMGGDMINGGNDPSTADSSLQEWYKPDDNHAEVCVIWGAQPSVSQTAQSGRSIAELRNSGKVKTVVVDPNWSPDAVHADVWLPLRPQSDCAMALTWIRYIIENKLYNEQFVKYWTNLPFLIDMDEASPNYKLPVLAQSLFPDFTQTTPENTPAYVCFDNKTGALVPFEFCLPENCPYDPEPFWEGDFKGTHYKTAGQIYKEEADPWTLEHGAEMTWCDAADIEKAVRIYAHADDGGCVEHVGGITHGVATDQMQISSQIPLGLHMLESLMGYIYRPGAALTKKGKDNRHTSRPVQLPGLMWYYYGYGWVIGMTEEENRAAHDAAVAENPEWAAYYSQMRRDTAGIVEHKGLAHWSNSHNPTILKAIQTGEPYKPHVWLDTSGNKFAMLANATSWYDILPELDFVMGNYPMLTSFHIEAADVFFPTREWAEMAFTGRYQLNEIWAETEVLHIGETSYYGTGIMQLYNKCLEKLGSVPLPEILGGADSDDACRQMVADAFGAPSHEELVANYDQYSPIVQEDYWQYDQHLDIVDDGLPAGFATESRKMEPYCSCLIKMARTGFPYFWPETLPACEDYSPICTYFEPVESPLTDEEYPYVMTSGRLPHFHHGTMRHAAFARELMPTAEVKMHPDVAAKHGIKHMDWVKITSRRATTYARAYLSEAMNPKGTLWMERFWNPECYDDSQQSISGGWREENVNVLSNNNGPYNEVFGSTTNRAFTVKIEKGERPERVWVQPEEFEPFMPTLTGEPLTGDVFSGGAPVANYSESLNKGE